MPDLQITSWSLIARAAEGDPADREVFARRYGRAIRSFFSARWKLPLDHEQVEDATQDVFVQCFASGGVLSKADRDHPSGFRPYLNGVAKHIALAVERRVAAKRGTRGESAICTQGVDAGLSSAFDRAWVQLLSVEAGELMVARATSPRTQNAVTALRLRFREGLTPADIATRLQLDVRVVYELIREAKATFRSAFLEVLASHDPRASEVDVMKKAADLIDLL